MTAKITTPVLVARLREAGRDVRVRSRRGAPPGGGVETVVGDLAAGQGVEGAVAGTEVVVHCAGSTEGDDDKARNLVRGASRAAVAHLVHMSVVGVELRATQFHELVLKVVEQMAELPVAPVPAGFRFQPIDSSEVAARLTEPALGDPDGSVSVPLPGAAARAFRDGGNRAEDSADGPDIPRAGASGWPCRRPSVAKRRVSEWTGWGFRWASGGKRDDMRRVLLAVDESDGSRRAAEFVERFFGGDEDVELTAVNVARAPIAWGAQPTGWVVPFGAVYGWPWGPAGPEAQAVYEAMERTEREAASRTAGQAPADADVEVVFGDPVDAIQLAAIDHGADLIVVGSNHKDLLQRWFGGSVSEAVVRDAPCPVLIVN